MGLVALSNNTRSIRCGSAAALAGLFALSAAPGAQAEQAQPWQMGFQPAASLVRERIDFLHNAILLPIITVIVLFVLGLLLFVIFRFRAKAHPVPSRVSHNTLLEMAWTAVPILILVVIAIPSFQLLYYEDHTEHAELTLKVTGHQWYWTYEYPDQGGFTFDSTMIPEDQAVKEGKQRLLDVDNPVVLPVNTNVRILVGGTDVIHSWFMPAFGVQEYAVVGRTNESWVNITREGTYYGQCNQICGQNHPYMPIEVKAVSKEEFDQWVSQAKQKFAARDDGTKPVAADQTVALATQPAPGSTNSISK